MSLGVGLGTSALTLILLTSVRATDVDHNNTGGSGNADDRSSSAQLDQDPAPTSDPDSDKLDLVDDARIFALDRDAVRIQVAVGDSVELVGLRPTIEAMTAEMIAEEAIVVAVTDQAVLLMINAEQAYRALEISAIGAIEILGLALPATTETGT